jgi:peptidoglycan hydrolase FlgJ
MTDTVLQNIGDLAIAGAQAAKGNIKLHGKTSLEAIDKNAKDFESMFMTQMLQPMFEGLHVDPMFGGGHGEEMMRSFLIQEYGKAIAAGGHLGIAAKVKDAMIKAQENAANQPTLNQGAAYAAAQ